MPAAIEVGMKFQTSVAGTVSGIRYYKGEPEHGHAYRIALVEHRNEAGDRHLHQRVQAVGWQTANFSSPVTMTAGTTYTVSYHTNYGHYSCNGQLFHVSM